MLTCDVCVWVCTIATRAMLARLKAAADLVGSAKKQLGDNIVVTTMQAEQRKAIIAATKVGCTDLHEAPACMAELP